MRALCGAIITAGALMGMGLAMIGYGMRYQNYPYLNAEGHAQWVEFKHMDTAFWLAVFVLLATLLIGLATAFIGLAYHHHKRTHELNHLLGNTQQPTRAAKHT